MIAMIAIYFTILLSWFFSLAEPLDEESCDLSEIKRLVMKKYQNCEFKQKEESYFLCLAFFHAPKTEKLHIKQIWQHFNVMKLKLRCTCSSLQSLWNVWKDIKCMDIRSNGYPRNWAGAVGLQLYPADNLFIFLTLR